MQHRRRRIVALAAAVLLSAAAFAFDDASAQMRGGRIGAGMGGRFGGGMPGHFSRGIGTGRMAVGAFAPRGARFAFHDRFAFRRPFAVRPHFRHFRRRFAFAAAPIIVGGSCWRWWRGAWIWVCY